MLKIDKFYYIDNNAIIFVLANLISFFRLFNFGIRAGMIVSLMGLLFVFLYSKKLLSNINLLFLFYLFFELISIFNYLVSKSVTEILTNNPGFVLKTFSYLIAPQIIFFLIGNYTGRDEKRIYNNISLLLYSSSIIIVIGILFFIFRPDFYVNYLKNAQSTFYLTETWFYPRLVSYMDSSMIIGSICASSFVLSLFYIKNTYIKFIIAVLFFLGAILSLQRSALLSIAIASFIMILFGGLKKIVKLFRNKFSILSLFFLFLFIVPLISYLLYLIFTNLDEQIYSNVLDRINSIPNAVSERKQAWLYSFDILSKNIFGTGIGILSHKAVNIGELQTIPDGNYFRILGEVGLIGMLSFILLVMFALYKGMLKRQYYLILAVFVMLFQAIGTNVFDLYYCSFIFWYLLGILSVRKDNLRNLNI